MMSLKMLSFALPVSRLWVCEKEVSVFYTDTQEGGGTLAQGRSQLLAQKLMPLTQLKTQVCTHTVPDTHKDAHILNYVRKSLNKGDSCSLSTYLCKKQNPLTRHFSLCESDVCSEEKPKGALTVSGVHCCVFERKSGRHTHTHWHIPDEVGGLWKYFDRKRENEVQWEKNMIMN